MKLAQAIPFSLYRVLSLSAILLLAACTTQAVATQAPAATATTSDLPTVQPTASAVASLEERLLARLELQFSDELVFAGGFVWVKTDDGRLIQVDPADNSIVHETQLDTTTDAFHYCQGLGTDGQSVWACSAAGDADRRSIDIVRVDLETGEILAALAVNKLFDQFELPFLDNQIWVLVDNGAALVGIDVNTNQTNPAIKLGSRCFQVAVAGSSLVAACTQDNLVLRIDPATGEVTQRASVRAPRNIAANASGVWVAQEGALLRLDAATLEPVIIFSGLPNLPAGDVFVTQDAVWVRQESGFVYRIDPASNQVVEQFVAEEGLQGGSLIVTGDSIWTTAATYGDNVNTPEQGLLLRLSLP